MSLHRAFILATLIFCFELKFSLGEDAALINIVSALRKGDNGRGFLTVEGQQREIVLSDDVSIRIGSVVISGLSMMDIVDSEAPEGQKQSVHLRFPQISLTSGVEVHQPVLDASTSGDAMLRFLDAKLVVEAVVAEGTVLEDVDVKLESGSTTLAFDLVDASPSLQNRLRELKESVDSIFKKMVEDKIADFLRNFEGERMEFAVSIPAASETAVSRANRFVDQLLADNRQMLQDAISVVKLPDEYFEFEKKILLVTTHGFARLTHGKLDNLHAIVRKGDCVVFQQNDALNLVINLGIDNVLGGYYIEVEFGVFGATSNLKIKIESVQLIIKGLHSFREIHAQENPEDTNILNFDLALNVQANLGNIDVDVNIFGPLDWLFNLIAEKVVSSLKGRLQGMIKDPIRDAIKGISGMKF